MSRAVAAHRRLAHRPHPTTPWPRDGSSASVAWGAAPTCAGQEGRLSRKPSRQTGQRWAGGWEDQPARKKVVSAGSHLGRPASDGRVDGKTSQRCRILGQPLRPARSFELGPAARGLADGEDRSRSVLRWPVGIGGEDHRPGARTRSAPGSVALSRAAGERFRRATGGAASRGDTLGTHVERAADELH